MPRAALVFAAMIVHGGCQLTSLDYLQKESACSLEDSGPIVATQDGQVIERLRIQASGTPAITVNGLNNVTIRNVEIRHSGGVGISFSDADDLAIENVSIEYTGARPSGPNPSSDHVNIMGTSSNRVHIKRVRLRNGSSGIELDDAPSSWLQFVEGHDFRGPPPRGQFVQWTTSDNSVLEDFSVVDGPASWTDGNISVRQSRNVTIRRGLVDGENSPSGVGVIFAGSASAGLVEDVDATHMGNGCFSNYEGGTGTIFRRTRCRDNICGDQGRGAPLSNGLMWSGHGDGIACCRIESSLYQNPCNPGNIYWPSAAFTAVDLRQADFTLRSGLAQTFCWE